MATAAYITDMITAGNFPADTIKSRTFAEVGAGGAGRNTVFIETTQAFPNGSEGITRIELPGTGQAFLSSLTPVKVPSGTGSFSIPATVDPDLPLVIDLVFKGTAFTPDLDLEDLTTEAYIWITTHV